MDPATGRGLPLTPGVAMLSFRPDDAHRAHRPLVALGADVS